MGEVHCARLEAEQALDGPPHFLRFELAGRGGRENELTPIDIQFAVGQAKRVARKNGTGRLVDNADVVTGMPRRIETEQFATAERNAGAFAGFDDAFGRDWQDVAIDAGDIFFAIDGGDAGDQLGRFGHVPCATWMHHQPGLRKFAHEMPGAAGMIKVDVCQDDVIDSAGIEPQFLQGKASVGEGILAAGIDEGDTPVVNDQVDRR